MWSTANNSSLVYTSETFAVKSNSDKTWTFVFKNNWTMFKDKCGGSCCSQGEINIKEKKFQDRKPILSRWRRSVCLPAEVWADGNAKTTQVPFSSWSWRVTSHISTLGSCWASWPLWSPLSTCSTCWLTSQSTSASTSTSTSSWAMFRWKAFVASPQN